VAVSSGGCPRECLECTGCVAAGVGVVVDIAVVAVEMNVIADAVADVADGS
jgi:hypothetical protein